MSDIKNSLSRNEVVTNEIKDKNKTMIIVRSPPGSTIEKLSNPNSPEV